MIVRSTVVRNWPLDKVVTILVFLFSGLRCTVPLRGAPYVLLWRVEFEVVRL